MLNESPWLTIVVIFYNNQREAERTLYTLSQDYQQNVHANNYNVIAIDNGSSKALNAEMVEGFGPNFKYHYFDTDLPAPCEALNWGIRQATTPYVMCIIDGAHMVTPNLIAESGVVFSAYPNAFVYTVPFHLGESLQNESMLRGYNQEKEDELLDSIDWKKNGYLLFSISEVRSAQHSFFSKVTESNCFAISKEVLLEKGGFNEEFTSVGGGLVNLDVFKQLVTDPKVKPVALIGEASFHQFHGGVTTNIKRKEHPISLYKEEYQRVKGHAYARPTYKPHYWGSLPMEAKDYMPVGSYREILQLSRKMANNGLAKSAIETLQSLVPHHRLHPSYFITIGFCYEKLMEWEQAEVNYKKALEILPEGTTSSSLADVLIKQNKLPEALEVLNLGLKYQFDNPEVLLKKALVHYRQKQRAQGDAVLEQVMKMIHGNSVFEPMIYQIAFRMCFGRNKLRLARQIISKALSFYPNTLQFIVMNGRLLIKEGNYQKAEATLSNVLQRLKPKDQGPIFIALGECYEKWNKFGKAYESFQKAHALMPNNERVKTELNKLQKEFSEAEAEAKAIKIRKELSKAEVEEANKKSLIKIVGNRTKNI